MSVSVPKQAVLDHVLALITDAAVRGARCPVVNEIERSLEQAGLPYGGAARSVPVLARAGKLKIEVFRHNYRVVTICDGAHRGKQTAPCPDAKARPYLVISPSGETSRPQRLRRAAPGGYGR